MTLGWNDPNDRQTKARRAVEVFRGMQPTLTGYAQAMTRRADVRVEVSATSNGQTDGKRIMLRPPISLGEHHQHILQLCNKRDETKQLLCPACAAREDVVIRIYHEIGHILNDSFAKPPERDAMSIVADAVKASGSRFAREKAVQLDRYFGSFVAMANAISPWTGVIFNALDDARVDAAMFRARPGTRVMYQAYLNRIRDSGIEVADLRTGEVVLQYWHERPLNYQVIFGLYCVATDYPITGWFHPSVTEHLADERLVALCRSATSAKDTRAIYRTCFLVLERLRELGYCRLPDEPEESQPEPEPEKGDGDAEEVPSEGGQPADDLGNTDDPGGSRGLVPDDRREVGGDEEETSEGGRPALDPGSSTDDHRDTDDPGRPGELVPDDGREVDGGDLGEHEGSGHAGDGADDPDGGGSDSSDETPGGAVRLSDVPEGQPTDETPDGEEDPLSGERDQDEAPEPGAPADTAQDDGDDPERGSADAGLPDADGGDLPAGRDDEGAGAADGLQGADEPEVELPEMGTPDGAGICIPLADGHGGEGGSVFGPAASDTERRDDKAVAVAIVQMDFFDQSSRYVSHVREIRWSDPEGAHPRATGWAKDQPRVDDPATKVSESVMGQALMRMRLAFAENAARRRTRGLKSGRVDTRVLGRRAPVDDERLFYKRSRPGRRKYMVLIGVDISGSTRREGVLPLIKKGALAQADLCHRLGIDFAVYAHTGEKALSDVEGMTVDVYFVKAHNEPWNSETRGRLMHLRSTSMNLDGHTMEYYRKVLQRSDATDRVLVYYTDGAMPMENFDEELSVLKREIRSMQARGTVVLAVAVHNDDPLQYGLDTVRLDSEQDVVRVVDRLGEKLAVRMVPG